MEMGYVEGRNVAIEHRSVDGDNQRMPLVAADLVRRQVPIIVVDTTNFAQAVKAATQSIPIVFVIGGDPVEFGLVPRLNRPAGNITGVATIGPGLTTKRLELLHKLVPAAESIAMFVGSSAPHYAAAETRDLQAASRALGVRVPVHNVARERAEKDIAAGFAALVEQRAGALLLSSSVIFEEARNQIISLAARHAIPTMFFDTASVEAGALSSYGSDMPDAYHQAGLYTGRILKGEKAGDLPVVQPTKFELVINLKTAKALGLNIPETLLATADELIQ
jgi:putative ABC transport system substrate-binding protein